MTSKHPRSRGRAARRRELPRSLSDFSVTVAEQLAALGVGALTLVDSNLVTARSQRADGFTVDDIGRRRTAVVAQRCQEINSQLEVLKHPHLTPSSIKKLDALVAPFGGLERAFAVRCNDWNGVAVTWMIGRRNAHVRSESGLGQAVRRSGVTDHRLRCSIPASFVVAGVVVQQLFAALATRRRTHTVRIPRSLLAAPIRERLNAYP